MRFRLPFRGLNRPSSSFTSKRSEKVVQAAQVAKKEAARIASEATNSDTDEEVRTICKEAARRLNNPLISETMIWTHTRNILRNRKDV